jgi:ribonuclease HI
MSKTLPEVIIYTDGGCEPNPGSGGWGAVILLEDGGAKEMSGAELKTTNNRMELTAVIEVLSSLEGRHDITLYTDSQYVQRGMTEWLQKWRSNGWKTSSRKTVKNKDLWQRLILLNSRHDILWKWCRAHAGDPHNERVDQLATEARRRMNYAE